MGKTFKDRDKWEQKQRGQDEVRRAKFDRRRLMEQIDEEDADTWSDRFDVDEHDDE